MGIYGDWKLCCVQNHCTAVVAVAITQIITIINQLCCRSCRWSAFLWHAPIFLFFFFFFLIASWVDICDKQNMKKYVYVGIIYSPHWVESLIQPAQNICCKHIVRQIKLRIQALIKGGCAHFTLCILHFQLIDLDLWNVFCEVSPWGNFLFTLQRQNKVCNPGDEAMM